MKRKDLFIQALDTFVSSWGGDTPPEACWGLNELIEWYEAEYDVNIGVYIGEEEDAWEKLEEIKKIISGRS